MVNIRKELDEELDKVSREWGLSKTEILHVALARFFEQDTQCLCESCKATQRARKFSKYAKKKLVFLKNTIHGDCIRDIYWPDFRPYDGEDVMVEIYRLIPKITKEDIIEES